MILSASSIPAKESTSYALQTCKRGGGMFLETDAIMSTAELAPKHRVIGIINELLEKRSVVGQVMEHEDLRERGLTSLDMVNLMLAVEVEFELKIPDDDMTLRNFRS